MIFDADYHDYIVIPKSNITNNVITFRFVNPIDRVQKIWCRNSFAEYGYNTAKCFCFDCLHNTTNNYMNAEECWTLSPIRPVLPKK